MIRGGYDCLFLDDARPPCANQTAFVASGKPTARCGSVGWQCLSLLVVSKTLASIQLARATRCDKSSQSCGGDLVLMKLLTVSTITKPRLWVNG